MTQTNIPQSKGEVWFLASCVEIYKDAKGLSGQEAYNYLQRTGGIGFIIRCWEGLHMTGPSYIIDSIDEYIANHPVSADGHSFPSKDTDKTTCPCGVKGS